MTDTDPVTLLREAASLMRWRARRAAPGPWRPVDGLYQDETFAAVLPPGGKADDPATWLVATGKRPPGSVSPQADADHIASWHPLVALAVADWLDAETAEAERYLTPPRHPFDWDCGRCGSDLSNGCTCWEAALAVARAYLATEER